jgi:hypothetical protein
MVFPIRPRWYVGVPLGLLLVVLAVVRAATSDFQVERNSSRIWSPGAPLAIAVRDGRATFRVPTLGVGSETLVIVSALSRSTGPFPIRMRAIATENMGLPDRVSAAIERRPRLRAYQPEPIPELPRGLPAPSREFHMMVCDGDVAIASNYLAVGGILRAVGKRVQVYVAAEDVEEVDPELLQDLVATFDERIFPVAARSTGLASDIDGDGRFTILLSSWLSRLGSGRHCVDGFVRTSDLDPVFTAPFGNRCDMMYLSTRLKPGPHLRTVLAHEYMHAVAFSGKPPPAGAGAVKIEEEGWLDEAIAHLAEDIYGFSRSNIDYRVSAFLAQPERYQLVVEDYYTSDLFRSHGNRGATYLFLRWCVDQYGPDLVGVLIKSPLRGTANLEEATGCSFAELFRRWTVALYFSGLDPALASSCGGECRTVNIRTRAVDWELAGPRAARLLPGGTEDRWSAAGTSSHFALVQSPVAGGLEVTITAPENAEIQVTAVPLPVGMARLCLRARSWTAADGDLRLRAEIREEDGRPVRLSALAWEPLVPAADPHAIGLQRGQLDTLGIASNFGTAALEGGATLLSRSIRLNNVHPESGPVILRLIGTDDLGRRVVAWADINTSLLEHEADSP